MAASALIVIDLIQDIAGEHGRINKSATQVTKRHLLEKTNHAIQEARKRFLPIIWVRVGFADDYYDMPQGSGLFAQVKHAGALKLSEFGCNWLDGLQQQAQDIFFDKKGISAFSGNDLAIWLLSQHIQNIAIAGVSSMMAIQSTARQGHDIGFAITVLEDLCAAPTQELHEQSMHALDGLATISTSEQWLSLFPKHKP